VSTVLVVGGYAQPWGWLDDAGMYDPVQDRWMVVPPLYSHGMNHTATVMQDGRVLVAGGCIGGGTFTARVEIFDPQTNAWTAWRELEMPETAGKFRRVGCGCSQWLVQADGTLLVPVQFQPEPGGDYQVTVLCCSFDGREMKYLKHGDELAIEGGRGFAEPSVVLFAGKYYLTLRNDARAYVTVGDDGLHFAPVQAWTFDDGQDLGSYNTQAHWLAHSDGLFLTYTRRGANNDHIARNRAPLFIAQVDPERMHVIRSTEKVLLPERGVMLGNFGAAAITAHESWVTDAEFISRLVDPLAGTRPHPRGADGTVWLGRVKWSRPNRFLMPSW